MNRGKRTILLISIVCILFLFIFLPMFVYGAVPQYISFQGKLLENGRTITGDREITFSIWDNNTGGDPASALWQETRTVKITEGIYNVELGAVTPLPGNLYTYDDLFLQLDVVHPTEGSQRLSPLMPFNSNVFALKAANADHATSAETSMSAGTATSADSADYATSAGTAVTADSAMNAVHATTAGYATDAGTATSANSADYATSAGTAVTADSATSAGYAANAGDADTVDGYQGGAFSLVGHSHGTIYYTESESDSRFVNISGDTMTGQLQISVASGDGLSSTASSTSGHGINGYASALSGSTYGVYGESASADPNSYGGYFTGTNGLYGFASTNAGVGVSGLQTGYGLADFPSVLKSGGFFGGSNGIVAVSKANYGKGVYAETSGENSYGVYGKVQSGTNSHAGYFQRGNIGVGAPTTAFNGDDVVIEDHDAVIGLYSSDGGSAGSAITLGEINDFGSLRNKWSAYRTTGAYAQLRFTFGTDPSYANNPSALTLDDSGYVGVGTSSPDAKLVVFGDGSSIAEGMLSIKNIGEDAGIRLYSSSIDIRHTIYNDSVSNMLRIAPGASTSGGISMSQSGRVGIGTGTLPLTATLVVAGRTKTTELEIIGGSDLSENFDISEREDEIKPGLVVSIDPGNPGKLILSGEAYDRKVAGIVSGAGGIGTGLLMGQKGSEADGAFPVALSGRVYCMTDASHGPIQPGDLLTTADTPGHAMKVINYEKAQGAILGKAMSSLHSGKGLVLVLVTLQ